MQKRNLISEIHRVFQNCGISGNQDQSWYQVTNNSSETTPFIVLSFLVNKPYVKFDKSVYSQINLLVYYLVLNEIK